MDAKGRGYGSTDKTDLQDLQDNQYMQDSVLSVCICGKLHLDNAAKGCYNRD